MSSSISLLISIASILCILGIIGVGYMVLQQEKKLRSFMIGKDGKSLEATLAWLTEKTARTDDVLAAHKEALDIIDSRVQKSIRGYSLIRYNAFTNDGGEQSFASGFLDEKGNGYVLSVITSRNHTGVYAKQIREFKPQQALTKEESLALAEAKKTL
ncbi:MAG: DUF4446 family protein [bacterium]